MEDTKEKSKPTSDSPPVQNATTSKQFTFNWPWSRPSRSDSPVVPEDAGGGAEPSKEVVSVPAPPSRVRVAAKHQSPTDFSLSVDNGVESESKAVNTLQVYACVAFILAMWIWRRRQLKGSAEDGSS